MNNLEFTKEVAEKAGSGVSQVAAKEWVRFIFEVLTEEIMVKDKVTIKNFGTFKRVLRPPQTRRDINTKELYTSPEKTFVIFKPSENLEALVAEQAPINKRKSKK